jgi:hypothetical protein
MKLIAFVVSMMLLSACNRPISTSIAKTANSLPYDSLIQRIVCFKFKANASPAAIQQHMRGFANLKDSISYILWYSGGPTVKGDLAENSEYDVMHYTTYRNEEEIKLYSVHPVHLRFIAQNKAIWEKVLVINSRIRP